LSALTHHLQTEISTSHLAKMTDSIGLLQHATYAVANREFGYCVDDNARGLLFTTYVESQEHLNFGLAKEQGVYLEFVRKAFNPENGRFRNFMNEAGAWVEEQGSDDSHSRTLWCLGSAIHRTRSEEHRKLAIHLFSEASKAMYSIHSPRSWAYAILAADEYLAQLPGTPYVHELLVEMASRLWREYRICAAPDWLWFEDVVSYANARLCQAMMIAGDLLAKPKMLNGGLESLQWLMANQRSKNDYFAPIGSNGFWKRGGERAWFDQQPLEAWCSVSACIRAEKITGDETWGEHARYAFAWFFGKNDLETAVCDPLTGGCRDGLHPDRVNENQGAESTLSFLCSEAEMKAAYGSPFKSSEAILF